MENNSASTEFKQLIAKGKEQGYLTIDEINDLIPPDIISGDQLSVFIQTFSDMGITVCETLQRLMIFLSTVPLSQIMKMLILLPISLRIL